MDLFNESKNTNLLPFDGEVNFYGSVMNIEKAQNYFDQLLQNIQWDNDKAIIFGKLIITKRKVAWYGDKPFDYTYSKTTKLALPWTKELLELKEIIEMIFILAFFLFSNKTHNKLVIIIARRGPFLA